VLQSLVYHADTLLQLAEGYRYREGAPRPACVRAAALTRAEHSTAMDFAERALFAYERALTGAFNPAAGVHRLDFDRAENRALFLALHRVVMSLLPLSAWRPG
jgi:hypothetical protein